MLKMFVFLDRLDCWKSTGHLDDMNIKEAYHVFSFLSDVFVEVLSHNGLPLGGIIYPPEYFNTYVNY